MKQIEKIIIVVILFLLISRFGAFLKDLYFVLNQGAEGPTSAQRILGHYISFILFSIVNIGSSIWLYIESGKAKLKIWIWTVFGLCFGLMAVAIFYLSSIHAHLKQAEKPGHDR